MPTRAVTASLTLTQEDEAELARVLGCKPGELPTELAPYASAALKEYVMMFLGQKVFTRGSDAESEALRTGFRRKPDSIPMIADSR